LPNVCDGSSSSRQRDGRDLKLVLHNDDPDLGQAGGTAHGYGFHDKVTAASTNSSLMMVGSDLSLTGSVFLF
jgi:hypothetical protein